MNLKELKTQSLPTVQEQPPDRRNQIRKKIKMKKKINIKRIGRRKGKKTLMQIRGTVLDPGSHQQRTTHKCEPQEQRDRREAWGAYSTPLRKRKAALKKGDL